MALSQGLGLRRARYPAWWVVLALFPVSFGQTSSAAEYSHRSERPVNSGFPMSSIKGRRVGERRGEVRLFDGIIPGFRQPRLDMSPDPTYVSSHLTPTLSPGNTHKPLYAYRFRDMPVSRKNNNRLPKFRPLNFDERKDANRARYSGQWSNGSMGPPPVFRPQKREKSRLYPSNGDTFQPVFGAPLGQGFEYHTYQYR